MAKKLKIYERFLLAIMFCSDVMVDLYKGGSTSYARRHFFSSWGPPGYKPSCFRQNLYRLLKTGYIEKVIKNNKPYLRLTSKADNKLKRDFPLFSFQKKKWDRKWRLVVFDISEEEKRLRERLRYKLKELNFGMLQKSIYISPYDFVQDMYEFLKIQKLLGKVFILTAKHELMGDPKDLAKYVWKLDQLEEEYEYLWQDILEINKKKNKAEAINKIKNKYFELIQKDPCLPKELLPVDWLEKEIRKAVVKL